MPEELRPHTKEQELSDFNRELTTFSNVIENKAETEGTFEGELFFAGYLYSEVKEKLQEKLGVDVEAKPLVRGVDDQGKEHMRGWKTSNPDWKVFVWDRDDGMQVIAMEETFEEEMIASMGFELQESKNP